MPERGSKQRRTLVLVAGSGRSGTSLFAGLMQRLGYLVPKPEVPADETNPRGFAESQWVVDFHTKLLKIAGVKVSDARPRAWGLTGKAALDTEVQRQLREWLEEQFGKNPHVIIKDPRLSWFLPLWRRCAIDLKVEPRSVTMLRHPAAVIDSKNRWYGPSQGDLARVAAWINFTLLTERATRELPRVFVQYDDLLEDWPQAIGRVGDVLDLEVVRDAPAAAMRAAHAYVDKGLSRSRADWEEMKLPPSLRSQIDALWALVSRLAEPDPPAADATADEFDSMRSAYVELYTEAEAIAQSSIAAASRPKVQAPKPPPAPGVRLARRVPKRYRHAVPLEWRLKIARMLGARTRRA
jgi:hypothetical protein